MATFESYERRIPQIQKVLDKYELGTLDDAKKLTEDYGLDVYAQVRGIQPICFENACWAYTLGAAIAIKKGCRRAADAAAAIGEGLLHPRLRCRSAEGRPRPRQPWQDAAGRGDRVLLLPGRP